MKYTVKLSVLLESVEYCSDVESEGYYLVKDTNQIIPYGEDLSEFRNDEKELTFLTSNKCLQLPTNHDLERFAPDWSKDITLKYIDVMISDEKQKKMLTKAYNSLFNNRILPAIPGSSKFCKELGKLGRMEEWDHFIIEMYEKLQMEFINKWCQEHNIGIEYDI
ncbi:MAG: hypothetical protein HUJ56_10490 [Erysipelotrichaceae bacterium]|nr:hypothetical protein [Erysipelotrichaceae bacterium]